MFDPGPSHRDPFRFPELGLDEPVKIGFAGSGDPFADEAFAGEVGEPIELEELGRQMEALDSAQFHHLVRKVVHDLVEHRREAQ